MMLFIVCIPLGLLSLFYGTRAYAEMLCLMEEVEYLKEQKGKE